jgi:Transposase and inactivated derivatives
MSRKSKIEAVEKIKIVERYLNGEISQKTAAKICSVNKRSVQDWIRICKAEGPTGLLEQSKNKRYSKELKLQAVNDYLDGNGSLDDLCIKYYRWLRKPKSDNELRNERIAKEIEKIHEAHPDMGYRRIRDELDANHRIAVNDKRVLRICRSRAIQSSIKWKPKSCTRADRNPDHIAKNFLHREFSADKPNEKWLTDVSEFKYYTGIEVYKIYLSAILDLYDRRIVAFKISDHHDNPLVMDTFDEAVMSEPKAHPLFHSDRGFQYTSTAFYNRLKKHHMRQSMSRVAHCTDNGPMEGFWGILKREMYYGHRFTSKKELVNGISGYIEYYNNQRLQRKLQVMPPMAYHELWLKSA